MKSENYAKALYLAISETKPQDHDKVLDNFVKILAQNGDIGLIGEIEQQYLAIDRREKGIKEVHVATASNISNKSILEELNSIVGDKAQVKHDIDQGLVGGVVVRVDDTLIDASVKNNLNNLKKAISNN